MTNPLPPAEHARRLTEQRNAATLRIDRVPVAEALALMRAEDHAVLHALEATAPQVERAVERVVKAFRAGGRLFYVGAGTSGRLGVLDASEQPPTFNVPREMVQGIIAGGAEALVRSIEGAEDRPEDGAAELRAREVNARDVVFGIAAGGRTPYVLGALAEARVIGAGTIFLTCTPPLEGEAELAEIQIHALVGPEVVTGSTRLKAGTVTKLILNQVTTVAMIQLGKVYENLMVDVRPVNAKLVDRACRIIGEVTGLGAADALRILREAEMDVKVAIVMAAGMLNPEQARDQLGKYEGHVAEAIHHIQSEQP